MNKKEIYLAGGCFWGAEAYLRQLPGVLDTEVGYGNGEMSEPSYEDVCSGETGAAECVRVVYDSDVMDTPLLLSAFLRTIDPTSVNRQGNDRGTQYRSGIYWTDPHDGEVAQALLERVQERLDGPVVVENEALTSFWPAEAYHQDYLQKNPSGYCHVNLADARCFVVEHSSEFGKVEDRVVLSTPLGRSIEAHGYEKPPSRELEERLSPLALAVTQEGATEPPHTSELNGNFRQGIYVDVTTGEPLFSSADKFEAGCGWPAFSKPIDRSVITKHEDTSIPYMPRTEVRSRSGNSHLGHVFEDGSAERGGLRYCINGAALRFIPVEAMEAEGYGYLIDALDLRPGLRD